MAKPRSRRYGQSLALLALVLAMVLPVSPAGAQQAPSSRAGLTKKGDIGPDGLPIAPGGKRVGNEVFYNNGRMVLRFDLARVAKLKGTAPPPAKYGYNDCTSGWFCLFQNINWGGRMLRFRDCCYFQYLGDFSNQASSWRNRLSINDARVWSVDESPPLWCSDTNSASANVGWHANDRADKIYIQSSDNYC